ncbi:MAG: YdeI/OmpD-associated family protein [Ferruginibacter sp.]
MKPLENINTFYAKNSDEWRSWLLENHLTKESIWLIIYKKESNIPSVCYQQAVDDALCFGWIDSLPNKRNDESYYQFFSKRNPKSNWSKVNKEKVERLLSENKMMTQGIKMVQLAKESGTWEALNKVDDLEIPNEMKEFFSKNELARVNFENFPASTKRGILQWIYSAKQHTTKLKRIAETVNLATNNIRALQYKPKE